MEGSTTSTLLFTSLVQTRISFTTTSLSSLSLVAGGLCELKVREEPEEDRIVEITKGEPAWEAPQL